MKERFHRDLVVFAEHVYAIKMLYASEIRMKCMLSQKLVY